MTDYVPYTPDEYAPDAPATALHFQRWFENWIAALEGAPGAPRLHPLAFGGVDAGDVVIEKVTPQGIAVQIATFSSGGSAFGTLARNYCPELPVFTVCNTGTIRIKGTYSSTTFRVYRNGTLVSSPTGTFSVDISVTAGDQIHFGCTMAYSHSSGGGTTTATLTNLQICGDALKNWRY